MFSSKKQTLWSETPKELKKFVYFFENPEERSQVKDTVRGQLESNQGLNRELLSGDRAEERLQKLEQVLDSKTIGKNTETTKKVHALVLRSIRNTLTQEQTQESPLMNFQRFDSNDKRGLSLEEFDHYLEYLGKAVDFYLSNSAMTLLTRFEKAEEKQKAVSILTRCPEAKNLIINSNIPLDEIQARVEAVLKIDGKVGEWFQSENSQNTFKDIRTALLAPQEFNPHKSAILGRKRLSYAEILAGIAGNSNELVQKFMKTGEVKEKTEAKNETPEQKALREKSEQSKKEQVGRLQTLLQSFEKTHPDAELKPVIIQAYRALQKGNLDLGKTLIAPLLQKFNIDGQAKESQETDFQFAEIEMVSPSEKIKSATLDPIEQIATSNEGLSYALRQMGDTEEAAKMMQGEMLQQIGQNPETFELLQMVLAVEIEEKSAEAEKKAEKKFAQMVETLKGTPEGDQLRMNKETKIAELKNIIVGLLAFDAVIKDSELRAELEKNPQLKNLVTEYSDMRGLDGILDFTDENAKMTQEVAIMLASMALTGGIMGAISSGARLGMLLGRIAASSRGGKLVQAGARVATEAAIFTGTDAGIRRVSEGKEITLDELTKKYGTNLAMFGLFGAAESATSRIIQAWKLEGTISQLGWKTGGDVVATLPMHLMETGHLPSSPQEWNDVLTMALAFRGGFKAFEGIFPKVAKMLQEKFPEMRKEEAKQKGENPAPRNHEEKVATHPSETGAATKEVRAFGKEYSVVPAGTPVRLEAPDLGGCSVVGVCLKDRSGNQHVLMTHFPHEANGRNLQELDGLLNNSGIPKSDITEVSFGICVYGKAENGVLIPENTFAIDAQNTLSINFPNAKMKGETTVYDRYKAPEPEASENPSGKKPRRRYASGEFTFSVENGVAHTSYKGSASNHLDAIPYKNRVEMNSKLSDDRNIKLERDGENLEMSPRHVAFERESGFQFKTQEQINAFDKAHEIGTVFNLSFAEKKEKFRILTKEAGMSLKEADFAIREGFAGKAVEKVDPSIITAENAMTHPRMQRLLTLVEQKTGHPVKSLDDLFQVMDSYAKEGKLQDLQTIINLSDTRLSDIVSLRKEWKTSKEEESFRRIERRGGETPEVQLKRIVENKELDPIIEKIKIFSEKFTQVEDFSKRTGKENGEMFGVKAGNNRTPLRGMADEAEEYIQAILNVKKSKDIAMENIRKAIPASDLGNKLLIEFQSYAKVVDEKAREASRYCLDMVHHRNNPKSKFFDSLRAEDHQKMQSLFELARKLIS